MNFYTPQSVPPTVNAEGRKLQNFGLIMSAAVHSLTKLLLVMKREFYASTSASFKSVGRTLCSITWFYSIDRKRSHLHLIYVFIWLLFYYHTKWINLISWVPVLFHHDFFDIIHNCVECHLKIASLMLSALTFSQSALIRENSKCLAYVNYPHATQRPSHLTIDPWKKQVWGIWLANVAKYACERAGLSADRFLFSPTWNGY